MKEEGRHWDYVSQQKIVRKSLNDFIHNKFLLCILCLGFTLFASLLLWKTILYCLMSVNSCFIRFIQLCSCSQWQGSFRTSYFILGRICKSTFHDCSVTRNASSPFTIFHCLFNTKYKLKYRLMYENFWELYQWDNWNLLKFPQYFIHRSVISFYLIINLSLSLFPLHCEHEHAKDKNHKLATFYQCPSSWSYYA